jgi:hypothetical protein
LEPEPDWDLELGYYPGRERKSQRPQDPARGQAVSASGKDQFGQKLEENRHRFLREVAARIGEDEGVRGGELLVIGERSHVDEFESSLPETVRLVALRGPDVIGESDGAIAARVDSLLDTAVAERESELIRSALDAAMARGGNGAVGSAETSGALAEGRVAHLLLEVGRRFPLNDLSPNARAQGDGNIEGGELMVELALRTSAEVTSVSGLAAAQLAQHGGVAALLRY